MKAEDLEKPLDPDLKYFDATPSIEELAEAMVQLQAASSMQLSINARLMEIVRNLQERLELLEGNGQKPSALLLPPGLNS